MGIGAAAYLGYEGAMGFAGLSFHIINHAFFKAGMFLMVGAIYLRTHDLDYDKLGGLWRSFPVTAVCFLIAGAAISGIPGFNGYASKTLLHHAIVEAVAHHGSMSLWFAEKIFVVTGGLTFCYILRLFLSIFAGPAREKSHKLAGETVLERMIFTTFAAVILLGGLLPGKVMQHVVIPMVEGFTYNHHVVEHLAHISVWNIHDLTGIAVSLAIGGMLFFILSRRNFALGLPLWLSVEERVYRPVLAVAGYAFTLTGKLIESITEGTLVGSIGPLSNFVRVFRLVERRVLPWVSVYIQQGLLTVRDRSHDFVSGRTRDAQGYLHQLELSAFFTMIKVDYNPRGEQLYRKMTLANLDFCIFIIIVTLVLIFSLRFLKFML
jgi:NADH:ubiquinone oxidoreductase subunit 5 (subunit L)/multisubunit Na+/H+ antiporter MnhA subunit